jgi:hypothetical protein
METYIYWINVTNQLCCLTVDQDMRRVERIGMLGNGQEPTAELGRDGF